VQQQRRLGGEHDILSGARPIDRESRHAISGQNASALSFIPKQHREGAAKLRKQRDAIAGERAGQAVGAGQPREFGWDDLIEVPHASEQEAVGEVSTTDLRTVVRDRESRAKETLAAVRHDGRESLASFVCGE
jgi:hypothetical protein